MTKKGTIILWANDTEPTFIIHKMRHGCLSCPYHEILKDVYTMHCRYNDMKVPFDGRGDDKIPEQCPIRTASTEYQPGGRWG
jgi:hypothetical protein